MLQEGDEEARELIQKVKVLVGLSEDDPPDSTWINMEKIDRKTGRKVRAFGMYRHKHISMLFIYIHSLDWKSAVLISRTLNSSKIGSFLRIQNHLSFMRLCARIAIHARKSAIAHMLSPDLER